MPSRCLQFSALLFRSDGKGSSPWEPNKKILKKNLKSFQILLEITPHTQTTKKKHVRPVLCRVGIHSSNPPREDRGRAVNHSVDGVSLGL